MPKNWLDWSDWKGKAHEPEHPLSKHIPRGLKGADVVRDALTKGHLPVMLDAPKQPTDEQMFGHLVKSEEHIRAMEEKWEKGFEEGFDKLKAPIDNLNKSSVTDKEWTPGKSFNSLLTEEERAERNMHVGRDEND